MNHQNYEPFDPMKSIQQTNNPKFENMDNSNYFDNPSSDPYNPFQNQIIDPYNYQTQVDSSFNGTEYIPYYQNDELSHVPYTHQSNDPYYYNPSVTADRSFQPVMNTENTPFSPVLQYPNVSIEPTDDIEILRQCVQSNKISEYHLQLCETIVENYCKHCTNTLSTYHSDYNSLMALLENMSQNVERYPKEEMLEIKKVIKQVIERMRKMITIINTDMESHKKLKQLRAEINERYIGIEKFNKKDGILDRISDVREILKRGQNERKKLYVIQCLKMIGVQISE